VSVLMRFWVLSFPALCP